MESSAGPVQRVAESAEEFALLSEVVDRLADDGPRRIYADWLEERGDERGVFLREFLAAYDAESELPPLTDVPADWADLTGLTIIERIAVAGIREFRDEVLSFARPALRLDVEEPDFDNPLPAPAAIGTTRLGGDPDLPAGAAFPVATDGVPLHFLGQFNLVDFRQTIAGRAFPEAGLLSMFRPQSDETNCYILDEDHPRLVQLIPAATPLSRLIRPADLTDMPAPYRPELRIRETLRIPASLSEWPAATISYEHYGKLDEVYPTNLGGEAFLLLGHATHGNTGEEPLAERPDWLQLVLVPFTEGPDFGVSDMSLSYQIPAADLKAGRFDRLTSSFG